MLSRAAQLSRLGSLAVQRTRPAVASGLSVRPFAATARTFASKNNSSPPPPPPSSKKPSQPSNEPAEPSTSAADAAKDAAPKNVAPEDAKVPETKEDEPIPFDKLPDLTQGIPSTLEAELDQQTGRRSESALEAVEQTGRRREKQDSYVPTSERNRRWWIRFLMVGSGVGAVSGIAYLGRGWDDDEEAARHPDIPSGWSPVLWWKRFRARFGDSVSYLQNPAFDKLLPDPDPSFSRPYTLCISLEDMLIHNEWTREHGYRVAKRPGFDYFIRYLSQYFEIVLFTTVPIANAEQVVQKLEPYGFITWPLFREATKFEDGAIVKACLQIPCST
jgi:import inner membrane translocase subunit TIM50